MLPAGMTLQSHLSVAVAVIHRTGYNCIKLCHNFQCGPWVETKLNDTCWKSLFYCFMTHTLHDAFTYKDLFSTLLAVGFPLHVSFPVLYYLYNDLKVILFFFWTFNKEKSPEQFSRLVRTLPPLGDGSLKPASGVVSKSVEFGVPTANLPNSEAANTNKDNQSAKDFVTGDHCFPVRS